MTSVTLTPPTSVTPALGGEVAKKAEHVCSRCKHEMVAGSGRVFGFAALYDAIRKTGVEKHRPLTRAEVLTQELCPSCSGLAVPTTFTVSGTLAVMERWGAENAARAEAARDHRRTAEGAWRQRSLERAIANQDRGMNAILAEGHKERKHHKKLSRRQQREQAALKHRAPKPEEGKKKNKKGKGGDKQKGGKGKGKKK